MSDVNQSDRKLYVGSKFHMTFNTKGLLKIRCESETRAYIECKMAVTFL